MADYDSCVILLAQALLAPAPGPRIDSCVILLPNVRSTNSKKKQNYDNRRVLRHRPRPVYIIGIGSNYSFSPGSAIVTNTTRANGSSVCHFVKKMVDYFNQWFWGRGGRFELKGIFNAPNLLLYHELSKTTTSDIIAELCKHRQWGTDIANSAAGSLDCFIEATGAGKGSLHYTLHSLPAPLYEVTHWSNTIYWIFYTCITFLSSFPSPKTLKCLVYMLWRGHSSFLSLWSRHVCSSCPCVVLGHSSLK